LTWRSSQKIVELFPHQFQPTGISLDTVALSQSEPVICPAGIFSTVYLVVTSVDGFLADGLQQIGLLRRKPEARIRRP
jgi:hypothetical protein